MKKAKLIFALILLMFELGSQVKIESVNGTLFDSKCIPANKNFQSKIGRNNIEYNCKFKNDSIYFSKTTMLWKTIIQKEKFIQAIKLEDKNLDKVSIQIDIDTSGKNFNNRIYISWADQKNGKNNWDVFLIYSDDEGEHFTEPILVSYRPNHKSQYSPSMTINQTNGDLFLCYFDNQNYVENEESDIYLAKSKNGGLLFEYAKLNETSISNIKYMDFKTNIVKRKNKLFAEWSFGSRNEFCRTEVNDSIYFYNSSFLNLDWVQLNKTFVYADSMAINFVCENKTKISFEITKPIDPAVNPILVGAKKFKKGNNTLLMDMKKLNLPRGNYTLTLYFKGLNKYVWITEE